MPVRTRARLRPGGLRRFGRGNLGHHVRRGRLLSDRFGHFLGHFLGGFLGHQAGHKLISQQLTGQDRLGVRDRLGVSDRLGDRLILFGGHLGQWLGSRLGFQDQDVEHGVVHDRRGNRFRLGRSQIGLAVRTATVVQADHRRVRRRPGVGADPEALPQGATQRHEVATGRALGRRLQRDIAGRPRFAGVPALSRLVAALGSQHPHPAQTQLPELQLIGVIVIRDRESGHQQRIVGPVGQFVTGAEVAWSQAVRPRHPDRGEHRIIAGQQDTVADGDLGRTRHMGQRNRPLPAPIATGQALERVQHQPWALTPHPQVSPDRTGQGDVLGGRAGQLHFSRSGLVDVLGQTRSSLIGGGRRAWVSDGVVAGRD